MHLPPKIGSLKKNMSVDDKETELIIGDKEFDIKIQEYRFSKASLRWKYFESRIRGYKEI